MLPALRTFEVKFRVDYRREVRLKEAGKATLNLSKGYVHWETPLGLNKTATAVMKATICQSETVMISRYLNSNDLRRRSFMIQWLFGFDTVPEPFFL